jgi:hypothetical protein
MTYDGQRRGRGKLFHKGLIMKDRKREENLLWLLPLAFEMAGLGFD